MQVVFDSSCQIRPDLQERLSTLICSDVDRVASLYPFKSISHFIIVGNEPQMLSKAIAKLNTSDSDRDEPITDNECFVACAKTTDRIVDNECISVIAIAQYIFNSYIEYILYRDAKKDKSCQAAHVVYHEVGHAIYNERMYRTYNLHCIPRTYDLRFEMQDYLLAQADILMAEYYAEMVANSTLLLEPGVSEEDIYTYCNKPCKYERNAIMAYVGDMLSSLVKWFSYYDTINKPTQRLLIQILPDYFVEQAAIIHDLLSKYYSTDMIDHPNRSFSGMAVAIEEMYNLLVYYRKQWK